MPQRKLSQREWQLVVRQLLDIEHLMSTLHGHTIVERGIDPADADESNSFVVSTAAERQALAVVLRAIGFDLAVDECPPPVQDQLGRLMGFASELDDSKRPASDKG